MADGNLHIANQQAAYRSVERNGTLTVCTNATKTTMRSTMAKKGPVMRMLVSFSAYEGMCAVGG